MKRRNFVKSLTKGVAFSTIITSCTKEKVNPQVPIPEVKSGILATRMAHLTDLHVLVNDTSVRNRIKKVFQKIQNRTPKVDSIMFGGDIIFETNDLSETQANQQWTEWQNIVKGEVSLPMHNCIGNHDFLQGIKTTESNFGQKFFLNKVGITSTFYSYKVQNWVVIVLNSITFSGNTLSYIPTLGEEQFTEVVHFRRTFK